MIVVSTVDDRRKGCALGADAYGVKPVDATWLRRDARPLRGDARDAVRVLTVDDEEASRFIVRELLNDREHEMVEAASGVDGLAKAHETPPDVILLDLRLGDMTGFDVLRAAAAAIRRPPACRSSS